MEGFKQEVKRSSRELTNREKVALKHVEAIKLDEVVTPEASITIEPTAWAVLNVHNEKSDRKDYEQYLIQDSEGVWYATGSQAFWDTFIDIWTDMDGEDDFSLNIYKVESKNYRGKYFITCNID